MTASTIARVPVSREQRDRVGERDDWICGICRVPVDPAARWRQSVPVPEATQAYADQLMSVPAAQFAAWAASHVLAARAADITVGRRRAALWQQWSQLMALTEGDHAAEWYEHFAAQDQLNRDYPPYLGVGTDWAKAWGMVRAYRERNHSYPSVDHIVALARGGPDIEDNMQITHLGCNLRKGARPL